MLFDDDEFFSRCTCARCGKQFTVIGGARYCSEACRKDLVEYSCVYCGGRFVRARGKRVPRFCCAEHYKEYRRFLIRMGANYRPRPVAPQVDCVTGSTLFVERPMEAPWASARVMA